MFDHNGIIDDTLINTKHKCVCFPDIAFRYLNEYKDGKILTYYDDFIENHYDPSRHILLSTGISADEIITIYKKYPNIIKGFGEFKCYDRWKYGKLPYGNLEWIRPVLEFNRTLKLPVYIHFNMDSESHRVEFEKLLIDYNDTPIVLCHCGMVDDDVVNEDIHMFVRQLMGMYNNLYVDLSTCKTRGFYLNNTNRLYQLPMDRVIVGSDINPIVKDVIDDPDSFVSDCYAEFNMLRSMGDFDKSIYKLFNITTTKCDRLIDAYRKEFNNLSRHSKIHLLTRGSLVNMFPRKLMVNTLKRNAKTLNRVIDLFEHDIDTLVDEYVLIGYTSNKRKRKIGELFKSVDTEYKRFLGLVTIMEMTYTFQRMGLLDMIDVDGIESIIDRNVNLIKTCLNDDKYEFRVHAATKYINASFFVYNLSKTFRSLNGLLSDSFYKDIVDDYINKCTDNPDETNLYGITHILIGASNFYTEKLPDTYNRVMNVLYNVVYNNRIFNSLTLDLRMELLLCCKLFGMNPNIDLSDEISLVELDKNEHTNMLYILYNKYRLQ